MRDVQRVISVFDKGITPRVKGGEGSKGGWITGGNKEKDAGHLVT